MLRGQESLLCNFSKPILPVTQTLLKICQKSLFYALSFPSFTITNIFFKLKFITILLEKAFCTFSWVINNQKLKIKFSQTLILKTYYRYSLFNRNISDSTLHIIQYNNNLSKLSNCWCPSWIIDDKEVQFNILTTWQRGKLMQ